MTIIVTSPVQASSDAANFTATQPVEILNAKVATQPVEAPGTRPVVHPTTSPDVTGSKSVKICSSMVILLTLMFTLMVYVR